MNIKTLLFSTVALLPLFVKAESSKELILTPKEVTIFKNQAQVTSKATTNLEIGIQTLVLKNLGKTVVQGSISVKALGDLVIMSINQDFNYLQEVKNPELVQRLKDSLTLFERQKSDMENQAEVLKKEESFYQTNWAIKGEQANLTVLEIQKMGDFLRQKFSEIRKSLSENTRKLEKLNQKIQKFNDQIAQNGINSEPNAEVEVRVKMNSPGKAEFEATYLVTNVGWQPVYDIRASEGKKNLNLLMKASVQQQSGIAWNNVKVKLSTANPMMGGEKPNLSAWYINFYTPQPQRFASGGGVPKAKMLAEPMMKATQSMKAEDMEANTMSDYTQANEVGLETEYGIEMPYSIASNNKPIQLDIRVLEIPVAFNHFAIPKVNSNTYFLAKAWNYAQYNLVAGSANLYFEGAFIGQTFIDPFQTLDTLFIPLGIDNRVSTKRERAVFQEKSMLGSKKTDTYTFTIDIKNNRKDAVLLFVEDQIPISSNEALKISVEEKSGGQISDNNIIKWQLSLKAGETKKLKLKYAIEYPKDKILNPIY